VRLRLGLGIEVGAVLIACLRERSGRRDDECAKDE
jgi:hypothetical protein